MNKILIVVDDQSTGTRFQDLLSQSGFYTAVVKGVGGMIGFCRIHTPDLIFLDVDIQDQSLWASVQAVRTYRDLANLPFLGVSNVGAPETLQKAQEYGFAGLIPKSIDSETLISSITSIMLETKQNRQTSGYSSLEKLIEISSEVDAVATSLRPKITEFGSDGPELFGYIENSSQDISNKLSSIAENDLADKELRHDFRNMIGSVTGFSELILMESELSDESRQGLTRLRECSKEFVELLDQQKAASVG
ncbi:MAG: response regulator [Verrucomicrobiales bacterium]|nr:response regulator [Verrucomicrobiales bacterium]